MALLQEALAGLSPDDSALRARVLARFSLELTFADEPRLRETVRESLSREALAMARRLGDVPTLALACRARWLAVWGPEGLAERSALAEEILELARKTGDRELELIGRARRLTGCLEAGDRPAVEADLAAQARLAGELRMPYHEWTAATLRAGWALLTGALEVAEELAERAPARLPGRPNAGFARLSQLTPIRWEQGRLGELRGARQAIVEQVPQAGFARGWLALAEAELGREDEARQSLRTLIEQLPGLPRSGLWLAALATAALAAGLLAEAEAAASVYPQLLPYAGRAIVLPMPHPVLCFGSAAGYLGLLATAMSRWEAAEEHFTAALEANTRLGARAFLARTQQEYARLLIRRGRATDRSRAWALLGQAEATARALGLVALGQEIERLREVAASPAGAGGRRESTVRAAGGGPHVFRREGDYWTVVDGGCLVRLRDGKGLRLLARLLAEPGREFHVVELEGEQHRREQHRGVRAGSAWGGGPRSGVAELAVRPDLGDAGELLDSQAKAEYKARLTDLRAELAEAERFHDPARAARITEEIDFLARELARAVGLGGRDRRAGSHAERARLNVTRAIKAALASLERHHPALGQHLRATIRTGTYCSYSPDPRVLIAWQL